MKTLLVTSRVTFVPENYARFVNRLAEHPQVSALLILENRSFAVWLKGFVLWLSRLAPGIGARLCANTWATLLRADPREAAFRLQNKPVYTLADINDPVGAKLIRDQGFDLVVNARTRYIYKDDVLAAPRLGCINIHHGILPDQRGVFCDLWALSEGRIAGFTVHRMSARLDDGEILRCEAMTAGEGLSYGQYLERGPAREAEVMGEVLDEIARSDRVQGMPNLKTPLTRYYRNPKKEDLKNMRQRGFTV